MDLGLEPIIQLFSAFSNPNNEIRAKAEECYMQLENSCLEKMVAIIIKIIESNYSETITFQALIRLEKILLKTAAESLTNEITEIISKFLLFYLQQSNASMIDNYVLSMIQSYSLLLFDAKKQWDGLIPFFINLLNIKPLISMEALTHFVSYIPDPVIPQILINVLNFQPNNPLFVQSVTTSLVLIKNGIIDNDFIMNLHNFLLMIPDNQLKIPVKTLKSAFRTDHVPFLPNLSNILLYFLTIISNSNHDELSRVLCLNVFSKMIIDSAECRRIMLNEAQIVIERFALCFSDPHQFPLIYKDAKKELKSILDCALDDIDIFDPYVKRMGLSDNLYISSIFLKHVDSEETLHFVFNNINSPDEYIRKNCFSILYHYIIQNPKCDEDVLNLIMSVLVFHINHCNFSNIIKIFMFFNEDITKHDALQLCIPPVVTLLQNNVYDLNLLVIASILCKYFPNLEGMANTALTLLNISKNILHTSDPDDNEINTKILLVISNILSEMNKNDTIQYLTQIMPLILISIDRISCPSMIKIIEQCPDEFVHFVPTTMKTLFNFTKRGIDVNVKSCDSKSQQEDDSFAVFEVDQKRVYIFDKNQFIWLNQVFEVFRFFLHQFTPLMLETEIFDQLIRTMLCFINFPYNDDLHNTVLNYFGEFQETLIFTNESMQKPFSDLFLIKLIDGISKEYSIENMNMYLSLIHGLSKITSNAEHLLHIYNLIPKLFNHILQMLHNYKNEDKYIDGMEVEYISQMFPLLNQLFDDCCENDITSALNIFQQIISIVPHFNIKVFLDSPNQRNNGEGTILHVTKLNDIFCEFMVQIWTDFYVYAPNDIGIEQHRNNLINDLLVLYQSPNKHLRKLSIQCITVICKERLPESIPQLITEYEKILSNDEEIRRVKESVVVNYGALLQKCDLNLFNQKIMIFLNMQPILEKSSYICDYCICLIDIIKHLVELNVENKEMFNTFQEIIINYFNMSVFNNLDIRNIVDAIETNPLPQLQPLIQYIMSRFSGAMEEEETED
ncbi:hypothetical protein TRFO_10972 [Tritrichomonas foetus]|uniref:Importin N-terminal domain-containing protein n=1 Tax=Tritrichomonas foetus TaxID=1144522 RepID=A0A1J4JBI1_9EUKA|nr:hypothetical protein TRFO_10972 [Tritrichomonas foetus]|eukprot:OHS94604.1 hypothetical protein TRFO_10972 [Tritrichomonas foetus]